MADLRSTAAERFEVRATASDHFAWIRTRLALERTMMAWLRTAIALIGFGFAMVEFFARFEQMSGTRPVRLPDAPYYLGLSLIFCGILALLISVWQYRWGLRYLWGEPFTPVAGVNNEEKQTPVIAVAVLLILIGLFALFAVLLRLRLV